MRNAKCEMKNDQQTDIKPVEQEEGNENAEHDETADGISHFSFPISHSSFPISHLKNILRKYWGYDSFRGIQQEIIESIASGHDTLGLMPTGGGKSITFQVPAMAMQGVCIVITPLIALMKDQVQHLRERGILAAAIHTGMSHDDVLRTLDNCILGRTKFLYISPERLGSDLFITKLRHMQVCFITVDEAHCISQWGYDFRPSYLQIARIREVQPNVPVLALTATATPRVIDDICEKLENNKDHQTHPQPLPCREGSGHPRSGMESQELSTPLPTREGQGGGSSFNIFRMSFERKNLTYIVRRTNDKMQELTHILQDSQGAAIVYVRSRDRSKEIAQQLTEAGISATYYHAGLQGTEKDQRQYDWQNDQKRVIVATNAFGMGIDKPDVRLVLHYDCPDSIEAYFQEAGRAGRDGQQAYAVLLVGKQDFTTLEQRISTTFPEKEYIRQVYEHLAYYYQIATGDGYGITHEFCIEQFCQRFHHFPPRVLAALQILQRAGYLEFSSEQDAKARLHFLLERDQLDRLNNITPDEERVVTTLLRNYGGLFADYQFISESEVARQCGMREQDVYEVLINLSKRHILSFIPRKQVPQIRYLQRREDAEHVVLPPAVYEERLEQYRTRIHAMMDYARRDDRCRSRLLLEYFGETSTHDCHKCDVCDGLTDEAEEADAKELILTLLSDGKPHPTSELYRLPCDTAAIDAALRQLVSEERLQQQDGMLKKAAE